MGSNQTSPQKIENLCTKNCTTSQKFEQKIRVIKLFLYTGSSSVPQHLGTNSPTSPLSPHIKHIPQINSVKNITKATAFAFLVPFFFFLQHSSILEKEKKGQEALSWAHVVCCLPFLNFKEGRGTSLRTTKTAQQKIRVPKNGSVNFVGKSWPCPLNFFKRQTCNSKIK